MIKLPRFEAEAGINNCLIISYNADITSLTEHALGFLEQQNKGSEKLRRTLIVSDIVGNDKADEVFYTNIQQIIARESVDRIVFIGYKLSENSERFTLENQLFFNTTRDFLKSDFIPQLNNEVILLRIAPEYEPLRILNHLQKLPHDTVLDVNIDALFHNVDYFRSKLSPDTKLMCMVKASAYGSGSVEAALALQDYGCNYFAVAFVNEGVELVEAGITAPILVLDTMLPALNHLFRFKLEPAVGSFQFLNKLIDEARIHNLKKYPIHIKLDTGMHRAGFDSDDLELLVDILKNQEVLEVKSIFSHLAGADEATSDMDSFTLQQIQEFDTNSRYIQSRFNHKILRHTLNTAGIERFSQYNFDIARLGIGLWGVNCCNEDKLRNVCSLSTRIMQLKVVREGETVGYNRKGLVETDKVIALLPLGYADGIDRRLGNGNGHLFLKDGSRVPIIGNICMDLMMIDVTGHKVRVGDKVVIFNDEQRISDIAVKLDTIPYELLTRIAPRVRRVYYRK